MNSKYQIFVSFTYNDLKDQRDLIIKAVLEMGHIPVGMEMFSAADEEQWGIIRRQIDQSDYYVVIVAHRYGSVADSGLSYTEKEYDYAASIGLPVLGFLLDENANWPTKFTDTDPIAVSSILQFKEKIKKRLVSFWRNSDDLYGKCSIALSKAFTAYPREGWVRASKATADPALSQELARLSAENASLRDKLKDLTLSEKQAHNKELRDIGNVLQRNKKEISVWRKDGKNWEKCDVFTLYQIYMALAPELFVEKSVADMSRFVAHILGKVDPSDLRWEWPAPANHIKEWMADFSSLGLVSPSSRKKPVSDKNEYWSLTEKGKELFTWIRRYNLELQTKEQPASKAAAA